MFIEEVLSKTMSAKKLKLTKTTKIVLQKLNSRIKCAVNSRINSNLQLQTKVLNLYCSKMLMRML